MPEETTTSFQPSKVVDEARNFISCIEWCRSHWLTAQDLERDRQRSAEGKDDCSVEHYADKCESYENQRDDHWRAATQSGWALVGVARVWKLAHGEILKLLSAYHPRFLPAVCGVRPEPLPDFEPALAEGGQLVTEANVRAGLEAAGLSEHGKSEALPTKNEVLREISEEDSDLYFKALGVNRARVRQNDRPLDIADRLTLHIRHIDRLYYFRRRKNMGKDGGWLPDRTDQDGVRYQRTAWRAQFFANRMIERLDDLPGTTPVPMVNTAIDLIARTHTWAKRGLMLIGLLSVQNGNVALGSAWDEHREDRNFEHLKWEEEGEDLAKRYLLLDNFSRAPAEQSEAQEGGAPQDYNENFYHGLNLPNDFAEALELCNTALGRAERLRTFFEDHDAMPSEYLRGCSIADPDYAERLIYAEKLASPDFLLEKFNIAHRSLWSDGDFGWDLVREIHVHLILARQERVAIPLPLPPGFPTDSAHYAVLALAHDFCEQTRLPLHELAERQAGAAERVTMLRDRVAKLPTINTVALESELRIEAVVGARLRGAAGAGVATGMPAANPSKLLVDETASEKSSSTKTVHSADFTTVVWFGTNYTFALGVQSEAVRILWAEWKKTGLGLHQATIGKQVDAERDSFRIDTAFRNHLALGTMITKVGDGKYKLSEPGTESKPSARITPKARRKRG